MILNKLKKVFKTTFDMEFTKTDFYFASIMLIGVLFFNIINAYIDNYSKDYTYITFPNDKINKGVIYKELDENKTLIIFFDKNVSPMFIDYTHLQPIKVEYQLWQGNKLIFESSMIASLSDKNKIVLSEKLELNNTK